MNPKMPAMTRRQSIATALGLAAAGRAASAQATPAATRLRLLTYNIHHAENSDGDIDLWRIADVIKAQRPELVAVQEVDVKTRRGEGTDQAAKLAELTGLHGVFGKFMDFSGGEYGQAVLSRLPIKSHENHPLPPGPEPRTALEVRVEVPREGGGARELVFVGNHLYATEGQRSAQARRLIELFKDETAPVVLAGDFNSEPLDPAMALLADHWTDPTLASDDRTWPASEPTVEIDYILYPRAAPFRFVESKVIPETEASDHRPVLTVLDWP